MTRIAVAVIGFEDRVYSVSESAGTAVVTVRLLSGGLSDTVVVRLETTDNTAQGECWTRMHFIS